MPINFSRKHHLFIFYQLFWFNSVLQFSILNAFLYDATVLDYRANKDKNCALKTVGKWSFSTGYGIGFPKKSKWLSVFNDELFELHKDGLYCVQMLISILK